MKRCRTCGENKPLTDYYIFKKRKTYFCDCKKCNINNTTDNTRLKKQAMQEGKLMSYYITVDDKFKSFYQTKRSLAGAIRRYKFLGKKFTWGEV